jgi:hypothetical protein
LELKSEEWLLLSYAVHRRGAKPFEFAQLPMGGLVFLYS